MKLNKLLYVTILLCWTVKSLAADSVLVVSVDGLHPVAIAAHTAPTLHGLMQPGRYSMQGRSTTPPHTLIAHTALLTGQAPRHISKADEEWQARAPQITWPTVFDDMKTSGYRTAYYYANPKLGYLINPSIGEHAHTPTEGIEQSRAFFKETGKRFVFLQLSGIPWEIYENRQFTKEYFAQLAHTDAALAPLFDDLRRRGSYVIVVTSAHSGPDAPTRTYDHPEDYKVPLITASNRNRTSILPDRHWPITDLRTLLATLIE